MPGLNVLCVCTGNIARSPALARILDAATDDSVTVSSAGTGAVTGASIDPPMASLLDAAGVASSGHVARDLTPAIIGESQLILCLDGGHRSRVVDLAPAAMRRTFLVRELSRLATGVRGEAEIAGDDDAARLRALLTVVAPYRGGLGPTEHDEVADPYGRDPAAYRAAFSDIVDAVDAIADVAALGGSGVVAQEHL